MSVEKSNNDDIAKSYSIKNMFTYCILIQINVDCRRNLKIRCTMYTMYNIIAS